MASRIPARAIPAPSGPGIIREICYGLTVAFIGGGIWKYQHLKERRHTEEFYDLLEKGKATVVLEK